MAWIKVDDQMVDHPKVEPLSDAAFRWWHKAMSYSNRFFTNGVLGDVFLVKVPTAIVDELTAVREGWKHPLWSRAGDGKVRIHDYTDYQPTKAEIEAERKKNRLRQAKWRAEHNGGNNGVSGGVRNGVTNGAPTRPGPARSKKDPPNPRSRGGKTQEIHVSRADRNEAKRFRDTAHGGQPCWHEPKCRTFSICIEKIAVGIALERQKVRKVN